MDVEPDILCTISTLRHPFEAFTNSKVVHMLNSFLNNHAGTIMNVEVLVTQPCPTLCDPMDHSPPGFSVHGILQARILEWVTIPFLEDLSCPGIEPRSPTLQADSLPSEPPGKWSNNKRLKS